jgi:hypothetical protein
MLIDSNSTVIKNLKKESAYRDRLEIDTIDFLAAVDQCREWLPRRPTTNSRSSELRRVL